MATTVVATIATHGVRAPRQHPTQHAGQQAVLGHAVGEPARHDHGQQRAVGDGDERDGAEQPVRDADARDAATTASSGPDDWDSSFGGRAVALAIPTRA